MTAERDICETDAVALAARVRRREVSPVEVIDAVLSRLERLNLTLNAFCTPVPSPARADAQRIERDHGRVHLSVKDVVARRRARTGGFFPHAGSFCSEPYSAMSPDYSPQRECLLLEFAHAG